MRASVAGGRLLHGTSEPAPERVELIAGHVRAILDGVDLRAVRVGDAPLVDRIYVAVRDRDWGTIPAVISNRVVRQGAGAFSVTFDARHQLREIDYAWRGAIEGDADGTIRCTMAGEARSSFAYCRIGFCVLHPDAQAGARYTARTPDGPVEGDLPTLVAPQTIVDGFEQPLFPAFDALDLETPTGERVRFAFSGDLFETEDQRNWTDASYKTYCTPIGRGYPYQAQPGQRIEQGVTIGVDSVGGRQASRATPAAPSTPPRATLTLGPDTGRLLPLIGLGIASDGPPLNDRERALLQALRLDHLRVDVRPSHADWRQHLDAAAHEASQLGAALEIALFVPAASDGTPDIAVVADVVARLRSTSIARWIVFDEATAGTGTTPAGLARAVRERLAAGPESAAPSGSAAAPVGAGTDGDFAELNRSRPVPDDLDGIAYAVNPRVHSADDRSIMENVTAQGATVETACSFAAGREVWVSPVTLAARFNPVASGPPPPTPEGELPSAVDHRQPSLLAAAWTVASVAGLAASGAASGTWFEAVGWRGLIERETGSRLPERFASAPGMTFPLYHVFADLAELREGTLVRTTSSRPRSLSGLAVRRGGRVNGLVANLTPEPLPIAVGPLSGEVRYRILDAVTAPLAVGDPEAFRRSGGAVDAVDGELRVELAAYGVIVFGADGAKEVPG